ncbi:unnamed protein product [Moneuplotes crassus]|uniref:Uncharacterized protein n=1 Tax=Euplotes crassus TaxID=5936 RepID=A0AAD1XNR4_EUPCR|nr:unnamed protein product [Moneuplotes crassus]
MIDRYRLTEVFSCCLFSNFLNNKSSRSCNGFSNLCVLDSFALFLFCNRLHFLRCLKFITQFLE